jgi:hypothetical protein
MNAYVNDESLNIITNNLYIPFFNVYIKTNPHQEKYRKRKMKKEIQSTKKLKTMTTTNVPKTIKPFISAITDFVAEIASMVSPSDGEKIKQLMIDRRSEFVELFKNSQKTETIKRVKDPNAPKRGKSSYIYFCLDKREYIKKKNPDMSAKDIIKELGRSWREDTSDKEKTRYSKMSVNDKVRYENEMKNYTPPVNVGNIVQKKGKTKRVGPKRGLTAYIFFCKEHRSIIKDEDPSLSAKDVTSELGKKWNNLSEKDRTPFNKLAELDKIRYNKEKNEWVDTKEVVTKKKPSVGKTPGYILFCKEERQNIKDANKSWSSQKITKELGLLWKGMSGDEKNHYHEPVKETVTKSKVTSDSDSGSESEDIVSEESE